MLGIIICLSGVFPMVVKGQPSNGEILEELKKHYIKSDSLSYYANDTLICFGKHFLVNSIDVHSLQVSVPNNYISNRDYNAASGLFVHDGRNRYFFNFSLFSGDTAHVRVKKGSFSVDIFFEDEVFSLHFMHSALVSVSRFWESFKGWNETIYLNRTDELLFEEVELFNAENLRDKINYLLGKNFSILSSGKRMTEEIYNHLF